MSTNAAGITFGPVSAALWDGLIAQSEQASVFNRREFLAALNPQMHIWGAFEKNELLAAATVQVDEAGHPLPPNESFNFHQGILVSAAVARLPDHSRCRRELAAIECLLTGLTQTYDNIWLSLHPRLRDLRAIQWLNYHTPEAGRFQINLYYTGILDLEGFATRAALVSSLARGRQGDYKKGLAQGIRVVGSTDVHLLDRLHAATFERQNASRGPFERQLIGMAQAALEGGFGELLVAYTADGAPASASLFLWDQRTGYYVFGASDPAYRSTGAATVVMVESLWHAIERGLSQIDFCGINSPQRGDFKTSFGAAPVPYFDIFWSRPATAASPRV